jgi:hypothetical protein
MARAALALVAWPTWRSGIRVNISAAPGGNFFQSLRFHGRFAC